MIEINITQKMIDDTMQYIDDLGGDHGAQWRLVNNRMEVGYLGEEVLASIIDAKRVNTYDYDFIKDGVKIDAKTKSSKFKPRGDHDVSIYPQQKKQGTDYYAFIRINEKDNIAWLLGIVSKQTYFDKAHMIKKGEKQWNGIIPKYDSYNMSVDTVWELSEHDKFL
jgi:hypothetical protein